MQTELKALVRRKSILTVIRQKRKGRNGGKNHGCI